MAKNKSTASAAQNQTATSEEAPKAPKHDLVALGSLLDERDKAIKDAEKAVSRAREGFSERLSAFEGAVIRRNGDLHRVVKGLGGKYSLRNLEIGYKNALAAEQQANA